MADYYGQGRTNYVKVKDVEKFKELCDEFNMHFIENGNGKVGFYTESEDGGTTIFVEPDEDESGDIIYNGDVQRDILDEVVPLLDDGEVLIFVHNGNEKMRYLGGYSYAINNKGESKSLNINSIFDLAKDLTDRPNDMTQPEC